MTSPLTILDHSRVPGHMVYPVRSRRSRGISIGINLFPHKKICDLDCIYCEVDNPGTSKVEPSVKLLNSELESIFNDIRAQRIFVNERINDIAFSGDGEPTISPLFAESVDVAIDIRRRLATPELKLVLITDALTLDRPATRAAVERMMQNGGEVWAKLDAGTEEYFKLVGRGHVSLTKQIRNIQAVGQRHPLVIQSMFLRIHNSPPPDAEVNAYIERLRELIAAGTQILRIDIYTIARPTTEAYATPLADAELDSICDRVSAAIGPAPPVERYYSGK
ncbi:MAG: radical SAM protein [Planctomycetota bacterium]